MCCQMHIVKLKKTTKFKQVALDVDELVDPLFS